MPYIIVAIAAVCGGGVIYSAATWATADEAWPPRVRQRVNQVYQLFAFSVCGAAAVAVSRAEIMMGGGVLSLYLVRGVGLVRKILF